MADNIYDWEAQNNQDEEKPLKITVKRTKKEIREDVETYKELRKEFKEEKETLKEAYVINNDWLKEWKRVTEYRLYPNIFRGDDDNEEVEIEALDNTILFLDPETYLSSSNNPILIPNNTSTCKVTSQKIWEFFKERYNGKGDLKVKVEKGTSYYSYYNKSASLDVKEPNYIKINFILLPKKQDFENDDNIQNTKTYLTYIDTEHKFGELPKLILDLIKEKELYSEIKEELKEEEPKKEEEIKKEEKKEESQKEEEIKKEEEIPSKQQQDEEKKEESKAAPPPNPQTESVSPIDKFHFWCLQGNIKMEELKEAFIKNKDKILEATEPIETGDDFNIHYVMQYADLKMEDLFPSTGYHYSSSEGKDSNGFHELILMIEQSPYFFKERKGKVIFDSCEYCRTRTALTYPCKCGEVAYCSLRCLELDKRFHADKCSASMNEDDPELSEDSKNGLVGMTNLGNTCFMNTSLQCLSNCFHLTKFFLTDQYKKDVNLTNPIGSKGKIVGAYTKVLKNLWYGKSDCYNPSFFKRSLGDYQRIFTGYHQHDTQEFLNYLLDGLHEDLNRVLKKPFVEKDESDSPDEIKSKRQWRDFLRRNQSIIVDLFYGQFKSSLMCPDPNCKNISITFDPFLSVSLPIPEKPKPVNVTVYYIFYDLTVLPLLLKFDFYEGEETFHDLRMRISKVLNIHPYSFFITEYKDSRVEKIIDNDESLREKKTYYYYSSNDKKYFCFEMNPELFYPNLIEDSLLTEHFEKNYSNEKLKEEMEKKKEFFKELNSAPLKTEEEEEGMEKKKEDSSFNKAVFNKNFGLSEDLMKFYLFMGYGKHDKNLSYDRIFIMPKDLGFRQLTFALFKYFYKFIWGGLKNIIMERIRLRILEEKKNKTEEELQKEEAEVKNDEDSDEAEINIILQNRNEEEKKMFDLIEKYTDLKKEDLTKEELIEVFNFFYPEGDKGDMTKEENVFPFIIKIVDWSKSTYWSKSNDDFKDIDLSKNPNLGELFDMTYEEKKAKTYYWTEEEKKKFTLILEANFNSNLFEKMEEYFHALTNLNNPLGLSDEEKKGYHYEKEEHISIYDCFKKFVKKETLEEENKWYCNKCKEHQRASKKIQLYKIPNFFIIHLKRFNNNSKIDTVVDFPITDLDVSNFVVGNKREGGDNEKYDLFAIANHYGSMGFGHYISYAKNNTDGKWYEFNDSSVSQIREDSLVSSSAYVLFYKKKNIDSLNWEEIYHKGFVDYEPEVEKEKKEKEEKEAKEKKEEKKEEEKKEEEKKEEEKKEEDKKEEEKN
ncbi:MAG: hypothetical protein MJ252_06960 [archaeon]|nr:hypothetical protein [archaeon]